MSAPRPEVASRNDGFATGLNAGQPENADLFNSQVPHAVTPGILNPGLPTGNGIGTSDQSRQLVGGGMLRTSNGGSQGDYAARLSFNDRRNI